MQPALPDYDWIAPPRTIFGWGRRREIGVAVRPLGRLAWIVAGSRRLLADGRIAEVAASLEAAGVAVAEIALHAGEPTDADIDGLVRRVRSLPRLPEVVVAVGGGAALDAAKAVAALAAQPDFSRTRDYLEGVGDGRTLSAPPWPLAALPTTGGTGSEATKNAVIASADPAMPFKKSLRHPDMMPRVALLDAELTASLPAAATLHSGMDAIVQLLESYLTRRPKPMAQALAWHGLELALPALPLALADGQAPGPRSALLYAAHLSGLALANSGLGLAHGVAAALGARCGVPHGLACAVLLPLALRVNLPVRQAELARLAPWAAGVPADAPDAASRTVEALSALGPSLGVPTRLGPLGVSRADILALARESFGNSMNGNPRPVEESELAGWLAEML